MTRHQRFDMMYTVQVTALLLTLVRADPPWARDGDSDSDDYGGGRGWRGGSGSGGGRNSDSGNGRYFGNEANGFGFGDMASFTRANRILIAHAVVASLVWVVLVPFGGLVLRVGLRSPAVLKVHAALQVVSYLLYITAAGLGVWLAQQMAVFGIWNDPHPVLGLVILGLAFFQPFLGAIHHRIFKKRSTAASSGTLGKPPGRTAVGRVHLWLGRLLIVLGIVNGGLGIRLASFSPFRTDAQTRISGIVYGVIAAVMVVLYVGMAARSEVWRKRAQTTTATPSAYQENKGLPSYDESQSSASSTLSRQLTGPPTSTQPRTDQPRYA